MRIQGKNIAVLIGAPGKEKVVGLSTSCSIDLQTDMIEMASTSDVFRSFLPGRSSMTIQVDRLFDTADSLSIIALQISRTPLTYIIEVGRDTISGEAYISSQSASTPVSGYATHNVTLTCSGLVTIDQDFIDFADSLVKQICADNWGGYSESITHVQAEAVTNIGTIFRGTAITSFDEFKFFTGVTSLARYAFKDCTSLERIALPDSLKETNQQAFEGCTALLSANLGNGLEKLIIRSFYGCSSLGEIRIPARVTQIGSMAFMNCTALSSIVMYPAEPPTLGSNALKNISPNAQIICPTGNAEKYKNATNWSDYADIIH